MKKVTIVHDQHDNSKNEYFEVDDLSQFLVEYFKGKRPVNLQFYHNGVSRQTIVTPKTIADIEYLENITGTIYVVIHPAYGWLIYVYYAIVAVMAAYSVYAVLTMPKPPSQASGSANNELAQRSNRPRLNGRIPDIYGEVRSFPDLIAQVYTKYIDNIEVEECVLCIGRGYYQIRDMKDGDTDVGNINGMAVSVYNPSASLIGPADWRIGNEFTHLPLEVQKSESINGQSLKQPNDVKLTSNEIWFEAPNLIKCSPSIDFTHGFASGDNIAIQNAVFGVSDVILTGEMLIKQNNHIVIETTRDIDNVSLFTGLQLTGATVEIVTKEGTTEVIEKRITRDLSGQYTVAAIQKTTIPTGFHYDIALTNPHYVNPSWALLNDDYQIIAGALLNKNIQGITLNGAYTISSLTPNVIALVNPVAINNEWEKLYTLPSKSTAGQAVSVQLDGVSNKWVGWFNVDMPNAEGMSINLTWPQGLYWQSKSGRRDPTESKVLIEYQQVDDNGNVVGAVQQRVLFFREYNLSQFGRTLEINFNFVGSFRFRACLDWYTDDSYHGEVKIKDVFAFAKTDKHSYDGITVIRTITPATDGALSVKDRKLNCLVRRMLPVDGVGELQPTKDAGQILINMALDPYIGRRSLHEIDIDQIKSEIQKVKDYFGSDKAVEFCYTFDDDKLSFEEQVGMVASACFCEAYRYGNKIRFKFEQPQPNSVLLFNHRNKVPGSEKRTWTIGINKDYDGVELEWTDPSDDTRTTYSVPEGGGAKNPLKITTSGIRNEAQAKTRAWREWNKLLYQTESVEFDALDESNLLQRNDRILVADGTSLETQDGEIESVDVLTLTLSQDVNFEDGQIYYIHLQMPDASIDIIQCLKAEQSNQVILTRVPRMPLVIDDDRYIRTTYSIIKATDTDKQAFLLTEMSPNDAMTNKLTCINYDDRYYEKDHSFF
ncbi:host specificity factor TipJ family phage tail protein [Acinetobacter rudis]|uniref:host specificity factor TipJ family phage tail protein n=1 Tax=Acinetobacter rudis TaxID=632955 RepID=UPI00333F8C53